MTVLVTGGAGYIGSHAVHALVDRGEDVLVVDRLSTGFDWLLPEAARLEVCDIADRAALERLMRANRVESILHFAGSIVVPDSVTDPLGYYRNNTVNSHGLIEAAVEAGVRHLVFSSTAATYGTVEGAPVGESAPLRPQSPYGWSKLMTEQMLLDTAAAHPLACSILRYFNVAGADPAGRTGQATRDATHLIKVAVEVAVGRRASLTVFGTDYPTPDGTCIRDYIHVADLAEAHLLALDRMRAGGGSLVANLGYGRGYSVREVLSAFAAVAGPIAVIEGPRRPGDVASIVADSSLARRELAWTPRYDDLPSIIEHALAWERRLQTRNRH